jgi:predicted LPLAT superfamily acyltransferase/glycosyltransferase involved in cell wall biosynthesis
MIVRCLVCIPTYNNSGSIADVVDEALSKSLLNILIIDDGSTTPVNTLLNNHLELGKRLTIHRFEENRGKGAAIQAAFKLALAQGYTHIITMDGDAQHKASDLPLLLDAILSNPWSMIIGKRILDGEHVPGSSKFGRAFSNFWVKYQTDETIEDSQSGFRAYPLFYVQHKKFYTKKYDFEIEVLIRLLWNKVNVIEVPIDVHYPPPHERVSHFDKFSDNVKISLLNTVLVIFSLLKSNVSRTKIIASISLGVFIGVMPVYGFHVLLGALFSFLFRLNFPLMFIAGNISIPPMIPVWTYISLKIGSAITGTPIHLTFDEHIFHNANAFFGILFLGSVVLGLVLALIFGIIMFFLTKRPAKKKAWSGKSRGGSFGNFFMKMMTTYFGPKTAYFFLFFICPYFYLFAPKAVIAHNQYFKILYPDKNFFSRQVLILKTFYKLGQVLIDNIYTAKANSKHFTLKRDGRENLSKALALGKGHILIGAHMGGWMFAAKIFDTDKQEGVDLPQINAVEFNTGAGHNSQDKIENAMMKFIQHSDQEAIFKINHALSKNEVVIFMADRVVNHNIELVPFLGKLAAIDSTAFKIAVAKKAPVSFTYGFKGKHQAYELFITEALMTEEILIKGKDAALLELIGHYTKSLESFLEKYPTQWFNFFTFWSALPSEEALLNAKKSTHHL